MPAPSHPETWTDYHGPWTTRKVRADEARDWRPVLPPMSPQLAQGIRDAEDAQRWPELQHGYGFADGTGTFTRIVEDGAA